MVHVGTAIIRRHKLDDEVLDNWYQQDPQPLDEQIELAVSEYIGAMPFLWLTGAGEVAQVMSGEGSPYGHLARR